MMQIRARRREDLERLNDEWRAWRERQGIVGRRGGKIIRTPTADYRWRIVVNEAAWRDVHEMLGELIDYENFKNAAGPIQPEAPLMTVWSAMHRYQQQAEPIEEDPRQLKWWDEEIDPAESHPTSQPF